MVAQIAPPPGSLALHRLCSSSGSLAMFAVYRRPLLRLNGCMSPSLAQS